MLQRGLLKIFAGGALLVLSAGYAAPSAKVEAAWFTSARPRADAASGLSGTWRGGGEEVANYARHLQTKITLQINDDRTFTGTETTAAKVTQLSGTVTTKGNRVILQTTSGSRLTLVRSGDTLYGIASEPTMDVVAVRLTKASEPSTSG